MLVMIYWNLKKKCASAHAVTDLKVWLMMANTFALLLNSSIHFHETVYDSSTIYKSFTSILICDLK